MYLKVFVVAGAKKEVVKKIKDTHYDISVREEAKNNIANNRVREILAREYLLPIGKVKIVTGHHSPHKIFSVDS